MDPISGGGRQIDYKQEIKDTAGSLGAAKNFYQAGRVAHGLEASTKLTQMFDIASGLTGGMTLSGEAGQAMADGLSATSSLAGGTTEAAAASKLASTATGAAGTATEAAGAVANTSKFAKVASAAGKAAPVVGKASAVLGGALGAIDVGRGINDLVHGKGEGKEKIIGGTCDMVTAGATALAATGVGAPIALGIAGAAQAIKYREQIADGAKWVGGKVADGAKAVGGAVSDGAGAVKDAIGGGIKKLFG